MKDPRLNFKDSVLAKECKYHWDCDQAFYLDGDKYYFSCNTKVINNKEELLVARPTLTSVQNWLIRIKGINLWVEFSTTGFWEWKILSPDPNCKENVFNLSSFYEDEKLDNNDALRLGIRVALRLIKKD